SRSVLPARLSSEERNEPVAASPARSIATTTPTPRATATTVRIVRSRSRRSGRRISVWSSLMRENGTSIVSSSFPSANNMSRTLLFLTLAVPMGLSAQAAPTFEVASIRPSVAGETAGRPVTLGLRVDGAQISGTFGLKDFIGIAYRVKAYQI